MASKLSKKGKNPNVIDAWLAALGYFRKNIAFDETCLFRAVAEQIFSSQLYHEKIRKECIKYANQNYEEFSHLVSNERHFHDHLDKLSKHMVICGNLELQIISKLYKYDIIFFDGSNHKQLNITQNNYDQLLLLCEVSPDHYDSVYKQEYIANAGFCQSIVYNVVYENIFHIPNVNNIVQAMLYDKTLTNPYLIDEFATKDLNADDANNNEISIKKEDLELDHQYNLTNWAPFPFKVAKALDPAIYRNIEYDTWTEMRKELRLGDWYNGDDNLTLGTRCKLRLNNAIYLCYLQNFLTDQSKCVVYVTDLAEKRIVNYNELSAEDDAKPWPLPYRFRKNAAVPVTPLLPPAEKETKPTRKKKDRKRIGLKNGNEKNLSLNIPANSAPQVNSSSLYEGCPLQIQESPQKFQTEPLPSAGFNETSMTPVMPEPLHTYEQNWPVSHPQESVWNSENLNGFSTPKMLMATTPDSSYAEQYFYYPIDESYNGTQWTDGSAETMTQTTPMAEAEIAQNETYNYVYDGRMNTFPTSPTVLGPMPQNPMYPVPMTPTSPVIEMYPPPIYSQPMSPMVYASPENGAADMIPTPIPMPMYTPPFTYVYPQAPTPTWYSHGINAQGFIFPTPVGPQNVSTRY